MRRAVAMALILFALASTLSACRTLVPEADAQITVYATFYPIYALTEGVARDVPDTQLHCLVQPQDGCLRNYQLSDWDAALLARSADAVIAGGRGLESFEDVLFGWGEDGPAISAVLYNLELYDQGQAAGGEPQPHFQGPNPHLYVSLEGAKQIVESISATMVSLDPVYSERYVQNAHAAIAALDALLESSKAKLEPYAGRRVALMSEALVYPARDYALEVAEVIERETGADFGDNELAAWLERLETTDADVVLIEKQAPQALKEALEAAGYAVASIDVFSTHVEGEGFDRYLEIQGENARALLNAFVSAEDRKEEH